MQHKRREDPVPTAATGHSQKRAERAEPVSLASGLYLLSLDRRVDVISARDQPAVGLLVSEDFCWRMACEDWSDRKPPIWCRARRRSWHDEQVALQAKKARIRELAAELCITPHSSQRRGPWPFRRG